jgi:glutathione S-transferase
MPTLKLVSHDLCPYVQRAAIVLAEKQASFERVYVDLANKPSWFLAISPLGKTPLLRIGSEDVLFESAVICEYLDETIAPRLHPEDAVARAKHRAWVEFASAMLADIWGYYTAADAAAFDEKRRSLAGKFTWLERTLRDGPYFAGERFSLVDAAFGPVFRYFDVFEKFFDPGIFDETPKIRAWREALAARPSVHAAVLHNYPERLTAFLRARQSHLLRLMN